MRLCDQCGTPLGAYSPQGLCARCLLADGWEGGQAPARSATPRRVGDYELLEVIAHGGMGVVWKARQISLDRIVALKLMLAGPWAGPDFLRRFRAEAEAAASVQHPNIVAIHEVGEQDGHPFFSMDYVEGRNLADLARDHPLPARRAANYLKALAEAVHCAHQRGVLHRDLKPSNILVDASDQPRITDFGLAKRFAAEDASPRRDPRAPRPEVASPLPEHTLPGQVLGSLHYLPPEQAAGRRHDLGPSGDVYALGAVLYHLLTARPPFQAETITDLLTQVATMEPVPPRLLNSSVPRDLETICLKCLEKEIPRRYATAQALAEDLDRFLAGRPVTARPVGLAGRAWRWCRRRPVRAGLIAALVCVVGLGLAGVLWQWRRAERHALATEEALWQANVERAHTWRVSGQMGQRVQALEAIRRAAAWRPSAALRTEAIAALAFPDLEDSGVWHSLPSGLGFMLLDGRGERVVMAVSSNRVEIRDVASGALQAVFTNRPATSWPNLSRDGSRLALFGPSRSLVWDLATGRTLWEAAGQVPLALSPDGTRLLRALPDGGALLLDLDRQEELVRLEETIPVRFASFSPCGERLALWRFGAIEIWNLATRRRESDLRLPGDIQGLAWHPDGSALVLGCVDHLIYVWSWKGRRTGVLRRHLREGITVHVHPEGDLLASGAFDDTLLLWDPHIQAPLLSAHGLGPLGFSADGQWLVVRGPRGLGRLRVRRPAECRLLHAGLGESQHHRGLDFSPDGRWLAGLSSGDCVVWDTLRGAVAWRQPLPDLRSVVFADSDTLLTASKDGLQRWTNAGPAVSWSPGPPTALLPRPGRMEHVSISRDQRRLLAHVDGAGALFDYPQPATEPRLWLRGQPFFARPVLSPDGQWIASGYWNSQGDYGSSLWVWSGADGQPASQIPSGSCLPDFSPDGRWLLVSGGTAYRFFAVAGPPSQWREVWRESRLVDNSVPGLARFAAHRNWLALQADDRVIRLLDLESRGELARLTPLASQLWALAWSADGRWLAAGSADHGTHLWDLHLLRGTLRELGLDWE